MVRPTELNGICGTWIHGVSGCGKTTSAYRAYPNAFLKPLSKWWDGYQGEEVVIIEDMDIYHRDLTYYFKIWPDFLPFVAEVKTAAIYIRPKKIIVTSQYSIAEIWGEDEKSFVAINRRFTSIEKIHGQDIILL